MHRLALIHTGGTIGMGPTRQGYAPQSGVLEAALVQVPGGAQIDLISMTPLIDSANATFADWNRIGAAIVQAHADHDAILVTHGTDTLAFTAAALSFALQGLRRPVILTGSMTPFGVPGSDALANLAGAVAAAQTAPPGVWVWFAGQLMQGPRLRKVQAQTHDAFAAAPSALPPHRPAQDLSLQSFAPSSLAILSMAPGMSAPALAAALAQCDGAVLRVFGAGTLPGDPALADALRAAQARGTLMIAVSQTTFGSIRLGTYAAGSLLLDTGVVGGGDISAEAAFAKLAHVLSLHPDMRDDALARNLCGEMG